MANRHGGKGGREKIYGNQEVFSSAAKGNKPGAITKAEGGKVIGKASGGRLDKRARGGGCDTSPYSSASKKG